MSLEPTVTPIPIRAPQKIVYASFFLSSEEFAVDVKRVQEVVNFPASIVPMPLAPDFMLGVFDLRGAIIPILSMKRLLGSRDDTLPPTSKVAILEIQGALLGLVFDDTSRVLRPRGDEQTSFEYADGSTHRVVGGVLRLAGNSLVQTLDPDELIRVQNVPHADVGGQVGHLGRRSVRLVVRKKCITFSVSGMKLGFAIGDIREIVTAHGLQASALQDELCTGVIHIRDRIIPVVSCARLLGKEPWTSPTADRRVIILDLDRERIGLLVDAVEGIDAYAPDAVMGVPILSKDRVAMFRGCVDLPERGHVFLICRDGIFAHAEIARITHNHGSLLAKQDDAEVRALRRGGDRQVYLSFRVHHLFAVPLREVKEIIDFTDAILPMPGAPPFVVGVLNLRGKLVVVADTRAVYRLRPADHALGAARKIVVFECDDALYGLIVDSVESIVTAPPGSSFPVPDVFHRSLEKGVQRDVREIIEVVGTDKQRVTLVVLNLARLLETVRVERQAA